MSRTVRQRPIDWSGRMPTGKETLLLLCHSREGEAVISQVREIPVRPMPRKFWPKERSFRRYRTRLNRPRWVPADARSRPTDYIAYVPEAGAGFIHQLKRDHRATGFRQHRRHRRQVRQDLKCLEEQKTSAPLFRNGHPEYDPDANRELDAPPRVAVGRRRQIVPDYEEYDL